MSLFQTTVTKFPAGSGRFTDFLWPAQDANRSSNANILNVQARITGDATTSSMGTVGVGTATFAQHNGVPCVKIAATNNATGVSFASDNLYALKAILTKGHGIPRGYNPYACARYAATLAFDTVPATSFDYGCEVVFPVNGTFPFILQTAVGGFGFVRRPSGLVSLLVQGAGLNEFPITIVGFDPTVFHQYEMRIISATKTSEAVFKSFVDGQPFQQLAWGAGSILPTYAAAAYPQAIAGLCNKSPVVSGPNLFVYELEVSTSETEAGLL